LKPPLPAVGGGDGIGRVVAAGDQVKNLKPGNLVRLLSLLNTDRLPRVCINKLFLHQLMPQRSKLVLGLRVSSSVTFKNENSANS